MAAEETPAERLRQLIKTDADPRVRQRAQAVLLVEQGHTLASVGRLLEMKPDRVRIWQRRYAAEGRRDAGGRRRWMRLRAPLSTTRWSRDHRRMGCR
jgi:Homeodomain-like domain-containing protein